ncbi:hypothetical protein L9F63_019359, partial [Diploptera punctata]
LSSQPAYTSTSNFYAFSVIRNAAFLVSSELYIYEISFIVRRKANLIFTYTFLLVLMLTLYSLLNY